MLLYADSEGPDQTALTRSLIWAFAAHICPEGTFSYDASLFMYHVSNKKNNLNLVAWKAVLQAYANSEGTDRSVYLIKTCVVRWNILESDFSGQRWPRPDYLAAHVDLGMRCLCVSKKTPFSQGAALTGVCYKMFFFFFFFFLFSHFEFCIWTTPFSVYFVATLRWVKISTEDSFR